MKALFPWIVVLVLLAGLGLLFSANQRQAADLAKFQGESQDSQKGRADDAAKPSATGGSDELARLRKENEDLLRLRNEVRLLKDEKQQLTKQLQAAQQAIPTQQQQQEMQKAIAEAQTLRTQAAHIQQTNIAAVCMSNLRQIEGAKQQWALENNRPVGSVVGAQGLLPYLPNKTFPICPAAGVYTIGTIGANPYCNIPGHVIPRQ